MSKQGFLRDSSNGRAKMCFQHPQVFKKESWQMQPTFDWDLTLMGSRSSYNLNIWLVATPEINLSDGTFMFKMASEAHSYQGH